jgi:hypothetical protein
MIDEDDNDYNDDEYGIVGGRRIGKGSRSNGINPARCYFVHGLSHKT